MDNRKAKILVTRALPANIEKRLLEGYAATLNEDDRQLSPEDIVAASAGHDGVFCCSTERLDAPAIDALADSVKIIVTLSVGYEHIDLEAAQRQGIVVTNTPDVLIDATADVALLCLLGAARRAWEGIDLVRSGRWNRWTTTMLLGVQVTGKRLGIYGMGSIGQSSYFPISRSHSERVASACQSTITIATDSSRDASRVQRITPGPRTCWRSATSCRSIARRPTKREVF